MVTMGLIVEWIMKKYGIRNDRRFWILFFLDLGFYIMIVVFFLYARELQMNYCDSVIEEVRNNCVCF